MAAKQIAHSLRWRYYDGQHPIAFINPKMNQVVPNGVVFKKNWCQVIVDASRNRLKVQAWNADDDATIETMEDIWKRVLHRAANDLHTAALSTGESYLVAWQGPTGKPVAYYHDPRQAHVIYEDEYPDVPRVACKRWVSNKTYYLNLYYPGTIEHYESKNEPMNASAYTLQSSELNPYGVIPVFHFRTGRRVCTGELTAGVLSLQDAMNKLLNDMMVSSEFTSFPQRWGIGHWDEQAGGLPVGPGTLLKIPAAEAGDQPSGVGAFPVGDPGNYLEPIDSMADAMAVLSATPKHYFTGQGANASGEALQAMEAPLIAKIELYQGILGEEWQRAMAFCLMIQGQTVDPEDIECIWQEPHTVQPQSQATTRLTNTQAGIPILNILRDEGWTEDQLNQLMEDARAMMAVAPKPTAGQAQPATPGPQGSVDEQAAVQRATVERQSNAIQAALLTALEAANVELVNRLVASGALDRMRASVT
jgi:hypothetical protein